MRLVVSTANRIHFEKHASATEVANNFTKSFEFNNLFP